MDAKRDWPILISTCSGLMQKLSCLKECRALPHGSETQIVTLKLRFRCRRARSWRPQVPDFKMLRVQACKSIISDRDREPFWPSPVLRYGNWVRYLHRGNPEAVRLIVGFRPKSGRESLFLSLSLSIDNECGQFDRLLNILAFLGPTYLMMSFNEMLGISRNKL